MAEEGFERKLAAILSADVEGYSRLMDDDEEATVRTLTSYRSAISDLVQQYRGRVVDSPGDNILAEFKSVVDAVNCAVEIQRELAERNAELPDNRKMHFRIGVNLGDVIDEDGRIYGDGVNIAARVESLAEAGGICISGRAHTQIENKLGLEYEDLGKHEVKNISRPIQVYRVLSYPGAAAHRAVQAKETLGRKWRNITIFAAIAVLVIGSLAYWQVYMRRPAVEPASIEKMALQLPDKPSIAVLPFNNFSKDPGQEYIADGITENIITTLSKTAKLFVIARNSVFAYKGKPVSVKQVSEDLGVRYILEGSVQISNNRIRITAQLIDAIKGAHIWAQKYDKNIDDIFQLQDEIALKILEALRVELTDGEQALLIGGDTKNLDAYLSFLKGLEQTWRFNKEGTALARKAALAAIEIDPLYPSGYRLLAWTHLMDIWLGVSKDPKMSVKKAFKLLEKVRSLDENSPGYYFLMGQLLLLTRQHDKAIKSGERAVSLSPSNATFLNGLAMIHRYNGEPEKALGLQKKAMRLNPYPESLYYTNLGHVYIDNEKYEEAIQAYSKAAQISPNQFLNHLGLAGAYSQLGHNEKARAAMSETLALRPQLSIEWAKRLPYRHKTDLDRAVARMEKAGLPKHPPLPLPDKPSIAVLAFDNLSGDPEQEYFSDGLTDELIGDLAKISGILVISRNSAFTYKGKQVKISQVAKELNVRYVLEGSVQKSGDKVRIRAQLIDGKTDHHLWAESYDGVMKDIFDLQDKITGRIVSALAVKLTPYEQEKVTYRGTDNVLAYEAFLKGKEYWIKQTPEDYLKAIEYYERAIKFDPNFSRAYAAIGQTYQTGSNYAWAGKMGIDPSTIRLLARKYLELAMKNPSPEAYSLAAAIEIHRRNFQKSVAFAEKAYSYGPNSANWLTGLGWILAFVGKSEESIELFNKAMRLDPLDVSKNTASCYLFIGVNYFSMGNLEEATTYLEKGLSLNPQATNFSCFIAAAHALLGYETEARKALVAYIQRLNGWHPPIQFLYYAWPFKDATVTDRLAKGLVKAGLQGNAQNYYKLGEENKLNDQEIEKLLFGKTYTGYVYGIQALKYVSYISDDGKVEFTYKGNTYTGKAWVENESICRVVEQYHGGLKNCAEIYRNPAGDELTKTEYFMVTDYGIFLFSIEK